MCHYYSSSALSFFWTDTDIFPWPRATHSSLARENFLIAFLPAAAFAGWSEVPWHQLSLALTLSHWESPPLLLLCVYFSSKTVPRPPTQCKQQARPHLWPPLLQSGQCSEGGLWGRLNREWRRNQSWAVAVHEHLKLLWLGSRERQRPHSRAQWSSDREAHGGSPQTWLHSLLSQDRSRWPSLPWKNTYVQWLAGPEGKCWFQWHLKPHIGKDLRTQCWYFGEWQCPGLGLVREKRRI